MERMAGAAGAAGDAGGGGAEAPPDVLGEDTEGLDAETEAALRSFLADPLAPSKLYGFRWEDGLVAPWKPCRGSSLSEALGALGLGPGDRLLDLGCGDGRILAEAAEGFGCRARGVELDGGLVSLARERAAALPEAVRERVEVAAGDLFDQSLWAWAEGHEGASEPTAIVMYLLPNTLEELRQSLELRLLQGAAVCTLQWPMPAWDAYRHAEGPGWHVYRSVRDA